MRTPTTGRPAPHPVGRRVRAAAFTAAFLATSLPALAAPPARSSGVLPTPPPTSVAAVDTNELRMHLQFLASEELGGRYTLSPSIKIAARYLASRLESFGFRGAGPGGSFYQPFDVESRKIDAPKSSLTLRVGTESADYAYGDFGSFEGGEGAADGAIVFVGYGISAPELGRDDYKGVDVKGKIVFVAPGNPAGLDSSKVPAAERDLEAAAAHGAVGAITVLPERFASFAKSPKFKEFVVAREDVRLKAGNRAEIPQVTLVGAAADRILAPLGFDSAKFYAAVGKGAEMAPKALDASARFEIRTLSHVEGSQNVMGILEGTDPKLRDEYVVLSAHYDHLKTDDKGHIYPGADDDGSGTAAVLTLAHAFSMERPKRSMLVVFHAGEELGLLGSAYNTDVAPAVPLDKLVCDLNIDMIGRSRPAGDKNPANAELTDANSIYVIGADKISKELDDISVRTNDEFAKMRLDYKYNDPNHPEQFYYRSDHWNYAKHGVPIIFYFSGVHADYHEPTDTIEKIDFDKMTKVARLVFDIGWRVANLDHRLAKDAPGAAKAAAR